MANQQHFVSDIVPDSFLEVDAVRLMLILTRFASRNPRDSEGLACKPDRPYAGHFAPEYYLHKLDFFVRYPLYFVLDLMRLRRHGIPSTNNRDAVAGLIRRVIATKEPALQTFPFLKFRHGAYERLDDVEGWWYSRKLVYTGLESRGDAPRWKHYFVTEHAYELATELVQEVEAARWYHQRIAELFQYFGTLSAAQLKELQYTHPEYRRTRLSQHIPNPTLAQVANEFAEVFGEDLRVCDDQ